MSNDADSVRARFARWRCRLVGRFGLCSHTARTVNLRRINADTVGVTCEKCGELLSAPYGLALPVRWVGAARIDAARKETKP